MGTFTSNHVGPNSARTRPLRTSKFESVLLLLLFVPLAVSIAQNPASGNTVPFRLHDRGALAEQSTGKSPPTIPDGLRNLSQSGSGLHTRSEHSPDASTTTVPRLDAKPIIDIQVSVNRLRPARVYAEPLVQLGYVHMPHPDDAVCPFFTDRWNGRTHITSTWFNSAERRNAARWHSAISYASTGMWRGNMSSSKNNLPPESMPRALPLAKHMRTRRPSSSSASFGSHLRRATHTAYKGLPLLLSNELRRRRMGHPRLRTMRLSTAISAQRFSEIPAFAGMLGAAVAKRPH